jgi:hypothetical protein
MRRIDSDWEILFKQYNILDAIKRDGLFVISSSQINKIHEARLMTKFDNTHNLPFVFEQNELSILPITRGSYIIGNFSAYQKIKYQNIDNVSLPLPSYIESISTNNLYSESACLNCAYAAGIINDLAESQAYPTVSGRMSSDTFDFQIRNTKNNMLQNITVVNSQIEIDGGFETEGALILIEAKNFTVDDFLIRQLYYPYRLWSNIIKKPVIPVFMTYSNDVFSFFIFKFQDPCIYNSIQLVKQKNYIIAPEEITIADIYQTLLSVSVESEPEVPFPQCNSFKRIVDFLSLLSQKNIMTDDDITSNYAFVYRQTSYYTNGAVYLDLVEKFMDNEKNVCYKLTPLGKSIMSKQYKQRNLCIVTQILKHEVFNKVLRKYFEQSAPITIKEITEIMKNCYIYHVEAESTVERRASTVSKWIEWIFDLQE